MFTVLEAFLANFCIKGNLDPIRILIRVTIMVLMEVLVSIPGNLSLVIFRIFVNVVFITKVVNLIVEGILHVSKIIMA